MRRFRRDFKKWEYRRKTSREVEKVAREFENKLMRK